MNLQIPELSLSPPQQPDLAGIRPPLDLVRMWTLVMLIQIGIERCRKATSPCSCRTEKLDVHAPGQ